MLRNFFPCPITKDISGSGEPVAVFPARAFARADKLKTGTARFTVIVIQRRRAVVPIPENVLPKDNEHWRLHRSGTVLFMHRLKVQSASEKYLKFDSGIRSGFQLLNEFKKSFLNYLSECVHRRIAAIPASKT